MKAAASSIVNGRRFSCDVGAFNEDYFIYIAAFGLFTEVSYATREDMKNVLGHMAYLLEGEKSLSNIKAYDLKVEGEDFSVEGSFLYGMVTNSVSVGGFKNITGKNVQLDDGEFEVTLIKKPNTAMEVNQIMSALVNRDISTESMYCFKTKALTITSKEGVAWTLEAGAEFWTPEAVMTYSSEGFEKMSSNFHHTFREHLCRGKYKHERRPVLINNWEATYFDFDKEKILNIAKGASELGVEMLVLDDGWFGKREGDVSGLGDWYVNTDKLEGGLKPIADGINAMGMTFGLWFEPECISEDSDLYRAHPDWAIQIPGRQPNRSRYQLILDMGREDVRDYLYERMTAILDSANIEYVKWDMNRHISDVYSAVLPKERQGEASHRYMLGLYDLLERLVSRYPDLLLEGCSGGGGRFDLGMLYYSPQIWCSDDTDAVERLSVQYGTSFCYPISTVGSHVSAVPNHQTGRITPVETRGTVAMAGSFGYELDLNLLSDGEKEEVKEQIKTFKKYYNLTHEGEYYRLTNPMENRLYVAWEFVSQDQSEALVHGMQILAQPSGPSIHIPVRGLKADAMYEVNGELVRSGRALMHGGLNFPRQTGDFKAVEFYLKEVK